jgi:hypothetical protein
MWRDTVCPDASGNIRGISLSGKAGETLDRIFKADPWQCLDCGGLRTPAAPNSFEDQREGRRCECEAEPWIPDIADAACKTCADTRLVRVHSHEDYGVSFESEWCPDCVTLCGFCEDEPATEDVMGEAACIDCWEKAYNLD